MTPNVKVSPTGGGRKLPAAAAAAPETQKVSPEKRKEEKGVCVCEGGKRWWWCGWKEEDRGGRSPVPNSVRKFLSVPSSLFLSLSLSLAVSPPLFLFALFSLLFFVFFGGIDLLLGGAVVSTGVGVGVGRETDDQIFPIQDGVGVGGRRNGGEEEEG